MTLPPDTPEDDAGATPFEAKRAARSLYWRGWTIGQIADELRLKRGTISSWKARDKWDDVSSLEVCEDAVSARFATLVAKEQKTGGDFKEIDLLGRQMERFERRRRYRDGGNEADLNPKVANRNGPNVKKKAKNLLDEDALEKLRADLDDGLFKHQVDWRNSTSLRTRFILKARQIGATWYFARERLIRALETGNNQIFLSASKAQAHIFRNYIVAWVQKIVGVKLQGDPIVIDRGEGMEPVELVFLGTNYRTAQGYHGDVIIDEAFWIYGFEELFKVASAMATQSRYTKTIFSTPSTLVHEAYPMWSGERFNRRRAKADRVRIDIDQTALKNGKMGPDQIWRHIVTLEDAIAGGYDLANIEELRFEYSVDEFDNLFRCIFLDDSQSTFPFMLMRPCLVDSWEIWRDFQPYAYRPFGNGEVWLGYDPNGGTMGDNAALVAIAPPKKPGGKFRILEKLRFKGVDYQGQDAEIRRMFERYNVTRIGIDRTGVGDAVFKLVSAWFPTAEGITYSPAVKTQMVLKAKSVIANGRLEFDAGWMDVVSSFMAIRPEVNRQGLTFTASRSGETGHADMAWAIMHALFFEPLDGSSAASGKSKMETW